MLSPEILKAIEEIGDEVKIINILEKRHKIEGRESIFKNVPALKNEREAKNK